MHHRLFPCSHSSCPRSSSLPPTQVDVLWWVWQAVEVHQLCKIIKRITFHSAVRIPRSSLPPSVIVIEFGFFGVAVTSLGFFVATGLACFICSSQFSFDRRSWYTSFAYFHKTVKRTTFHSAAPGRRDAALVTRSGADSKGGTGIEAPTAHSGDPEHSSARN